MSPAGSTRHRPTRMPRGMPLLAALGAAFLVLPLVALVWRAPWGELVARLTDPTTLDALRLSLVSASSATALSVVLGVPLAWVLARAAVPGLRVLRALVTVPLVLPPVVGGVALLLLLGRRGLAGQYLHAWFGVQIPFTTLAVVIAEAFVAMPFLVVSVEGALRGVDRRAEDAACDARRRTLVRRAPRHAAGGRPGPGRRHGADLRAGPGRVRRDDHVRGEPAGHHPDHAPGDLPGDAERPGCGDRPVPGAARHLRGGPGRAA